jgi:hypothetical protein
VDAWRQDYNADLPHQSLSMAFPSSRFAPATGEVPGLRVPADLAPPKSVHLTDEQPAAEVVQPSGSSPEEGVRPAAAQPVELDRVVPPSGNMWVAGQQIWLGPAMTGRTVRIWAGLDRVHVLLDGHPIKTLPSRLDIIDLARLAAAGARPAGPPPLPPASGHVIEVERTVSASGNVSIGDHVISAGMPLAAQRITVRLDGLIAHIVASGTVVRTIACLIPQAARSQLRGARAGTASPAVLPEPQTVRRRISVRGAIMTGGQRIQGRPPARGQDRRDHRRARHLPDHRRARHLPDRRRRRRRPDSATHHQPRHPAPQGLELSRRLTAAPRTG